MWGKNYHQNITATSAVIIIASVIVSDIAIVEVFTAIVTNDTVDARDKNSSRLQGRRVLVSGPRWATGKTNVRERTASPSWEYNSHLARAAHVIPRDLSVSSE